MERTCQAQLLAEAAGTPIKISDEAARHTAQPGRLPRRRLVQLPPLYDWIVREQPDLLD